MMCIINECTFIQFDILKALMCHGAGDSPIPTELQSPAHCGDQRTQPFTLSSAPRVNL